MHPRWVASVWVFDRLIMLLAGDQDPERPGTVVRQPGIRETILFPLMKPEA